MPTIVTPESEPGQCRHPLDRARQLANRARKHDVAGATLEAQRCRRFAFAVIQYHLLTADDSPAPGAWALDRLLAAHERRAASA